MYVYIIISNKLFWQFSHLYFFHPVHVVPLTGVVSVSGWRQSDGGTDRHSACLKTLGALRTLHNVYIKPASHSSCLVQCVCHAVKSSASSCWCHSVPHSWPAMLIHKSSESFKMTNILVYFVQCSEVVSDEQHKYYSLFISSPKSFHIINRVNMFCEALQSFQMT